MEGVLGLRSVLIPRCVAASGGWGGRSAGETRRQHPWWGREADPDGAAEEAVRGQAVPSTRTVNRILVVPRSGGATEAERSAGVLCGGNGRADPRHLRL